MSDQLYEPFERTIAAGATETIEASRQPERWLLYPSDSTFSGTLAVSPGSSVPASGVQRLLAYARLIVPGIGQRVSIRNDTGVPVPVVVTAVTGLPLEIDRLAQGGEIGNPDKGVRMRATSNYSVADSTESFWTFNAYDYDTDSMYRGSPENRLVFNTAGKFFVWAQVVWEINTGSYNKQYLYLWKNQTEVIAYNQEPFMQGGVQGQWNSRNAIGAWTVYNFAAGDYLQAVVYQNTGANRTLLGLTSCSPVMGAQRLAG